MIGVVYLVWGPLGTRHLREFVDSYQEHRAGVDHELIVVYNGVGKDERSAFGVELETTDHRLIELQTPVLDLAAYMQATALLDHERLCFLNSYSVILAPDWLAKLNDALNEPKVGLVGATGSWASHRSARLNSLFLPNPYKGVLPKGRFRNFPALERALDIERDSEQRSLHELDLNKDNPVLGSHWYIMHALKGLARTPGDIRNFESFPAHHIRTNGFMTRSLTFGSLQLGPIKRKTDAYVLESGHKSFTRQVEREGLRVLVVASNGDGYEHKQWPLSETLWQEQQSRLLIGDNQTRLYERMTFERRQFLSALAWGSQGRPRAPKEPSNSDPYCDR